MPSKQIVRAMIYSFGSITQYGRIQKAKTRNIHPKSLKNAGKELWSGERGGTHRQRPLRRYELVTNSIRPAGRVRLDKLETSRHSDIKP